MGLHCGLDFDTSDSESWWYELPQGDFETLTSKRARKCCSCDRRIQPGEDVLIVPRARSARSDIEERFHGNEVELAPWHLCEECGGLALSLNEVGFCYELGYGQSLKAQIIEYRRDVAFDEQVNRYQTPNAPHERTAERR